MKIYAYYQEEFHTGIKFNETNHHSTVEGALAELKAKYPELDDDLIDVQFELSVIDVIID